ncbi:MAG: hypothetical protein Unbinned338contig1000_5 [Prokaryotic dsDNA virus sp.]|nr:MAG: hypothetical protein Unbinned338contig1000_5 [Prokaryotic dsDNA virus sp.]|tara:strand:- start:1755 stop:1976 length:222 start_codon:yes stop_codon:yes gene_type:complete
MNLLLPAFSRFALASPDEPHQIGTQDGELCNRLPEPDEDQPRGYRHKPCTGTMECNEGYVICDVCGEEADRCP